jgi:hypothetical protein
MNRNTVTNIGTAPSSVAILAGIDYAIGEIIPIDADLQNDPEPFRCFWQN